MRIDLINCIFDLLQKNNTVVLPGLGTLSLDRTHARIAGNKIHPPFRSIKFSSKIGSLDQFVAYLSLTYGISTDNAERVLKRFSQRMINQLVNYNEVVLPKIGILKSTGGKSLKLSKDDSFVNFTSNYLPVLKLERLGSKKKDVKKVIIESDVAITSSEEATTIIQQKVEPLKSSLIETIAPIAAISPEVTPITKVKGLSNNLGKQVSSAPAKVNTGTVVLSAKELSDVNTDSAMYGMGSESLEKPFNWGFLKYILLAMLLAFLFYYGCKDTGIGVTGESESELVTGGDISAGDVITDAAIYDPNKKYGVKDLHLIPKSYLEQGCVIIVGSFRKNSNVLRMKEKLETKGFKTYQEINKDGLKRVGLSFDCVDEDLVAYIQKVRKDIDSEAWYLLPQLHID